jgi:hypothetical protein
MKEVTSWVKVGVGHVCSTQPTQLESNLRKVGRTFYNTGSTGCRRPPDGDTWPSTKRTKSMITRNLLNRTQHMNTTHVKHRYKPFDTRRRADSNLRANNRTYRGDMQAASQNSQVDTLRRLSMLRRRRRTQRQLSPACTRMQPSRRSSSYSTAYFQMCIHNRPFFD